MTLVYVEHCLKVKDGTSKQWPGNILASQVGIHTCDIIDAFIWSQSLLVPHPLLWKKSLQLQRLLPQAQSSGEGERCWRLSLSSICVVILGRLNKSRKKCGLLLNRAPPKSPDSQGLLDPPGPQESWIILYHLKPFELHIEQFRKFKPIFRMGWAGSIKEQYDT